jgi:arylsulfatase A-like enzyme
MVGVALPEGPATDGRSLTPLLKDADAHLARDALFFHYPHYYSTTSPVSAVRAGDWKLLDYYEDRRLELYNLREDLGEHTNLAQQKADKAQDLRDRLRGWLSAVGAQMPSPNAAARPAR